MTIYVLIQGPVHLREFSNEARLEDGILYIENNPKISKIHISYQKIFKVVISNLPNLAALTVKLNLQESTELVLNSGLDNLRSIHSNVNKVRINYPLTNLREVYFNNAGNELLSFDFEKLTKKVLLTIAHYDPIFDQINLNSKFYRIARPLNKYHQARNRINRLRIAIKILIKLFLKNRIKYLFDRYLESTRDGISRFCYLSNK